MPVWYYLAFIETLVFLVLIFSDSRPGFSGFCLSLCFVVAGVFSYAVQMRMVRVDWPDYDYEYHGQLTAYPLEREKSYRLELSLTDSNYKGRNIYLYVPKDSDVLALEPGQIIVFNGIVNKPSSQGAGFDYESYLLSHGISGTLMVLSQFWEPMPSPDRLSLKMRSVRLRRNVIRKYQEWGLKGDALAVTAAVSLGEKRQLDDDLKQIYSTSGVSHVLAVSGLHVGIMCWFLYLLLPGLLFRKIGWIRELIVMGVLWAYAFAIGLPVSITRSLIMFSIISVCRAISRESSALNSLGVAALLMLMAKPSMLFDMSFQLSFSAVLFIVLLTPVLLELLKPRTFIGQYIWRISVLSISAQIGTSPLIMYHFSNFSTYVLIANLFVVPAMFVVVALSMSLWITGWFPAIRVVVVNILTWMVDALTKMLSGVAAWPYSNLELSLSSGWSILLIYLVVLFIYLWIKLKRTHHLVQALACIAVASVLALVQRFAV